MRHEVTHSCGHAEQHTLFGTFAADIDRQARQLSRRKCTVCYKTAKASKVATGEALLADVELPPLTGSEKQVSWAETIRIERLAVLHRANPEAVTGFIAIAQAKWWIDNRAADLRKMTPPS